MTALPICRTGIDELKAGDVVEVDGRFPCLEQNVLYVVYEHLSRLYIFCNHPDKTRIMHWLMVTSDGVQGWYEGYKKVLDKNP